MASNNSYQFGSNLNTNYDGSRFHSRGRGRGGQAPRFNRGRGQRGFQNRGGNFDRSERGRGSQFSHTGQFQRHSSHGSGSNNWQTASNTSLNNWQAMKSKANSEYTSDNFEQGPTAEDFVEQHHFAYEYDEDASNQDPNNSSYEQVPEYRQSVESTGVDNPVDEGTETMADNPYEVELPDNLYEYDETQTVTDVQSGQFQQQDKQKGPKVELSGGQFQHQQQQKKQQQQQQPQQQQPLESGDKGTISGEHKQQQQPEAGDSGDESEEDTGFCKYCKVPFTTIGAYNAHVRGIQHTTRYMEAKSRVNAEFKASVEPIVTPSVSGTSSSSTAPVVNKPGQFAGAGQSKAPVIDKPGQFAGTGQQGTSGQFAGAGQFAGTGQQSTEGQFADTGQQNTAGQFADTGQQSTAGQFADTGQQNTASQFAGSGQQVKQVENNQEEDADSDSSEEDTGYCKYCKINFTSAKAFHAHTRGIQHTTLVMEAKAQQGDVRFKKEIVAPEVLEVRVPEPRPVQPEIPRDYDIEDNWMDLDNEVIDYIKQRKQIDNKDLHPEEIGKKVGDDYNCPLCEIFCTGPAAFKSHLEGKSHKQKMAQAEQGVLYRKKKPNAAAVHVPSHGRPSKLSILIKDNENPMLGLDYVTEFQKSDYKKLANYVCNLCESKMDEYAIIPHLIGSKHRLHYLKLAKPSLYDHVTKYSSKKRKSEINATIEEFALEIEKETGRKDVKIKIEIVEEEDMVDLEDSMMKASKELRDKVNAMQKAGIVVKGDEGEPVSKRGKYGPGPSGKAADWKRDRSPPRYRDPVRALSRGNDFHGARDRDTDRGREYAWGRDRDIARDRGDLARDRGDLARDRDFARGRGDIMRDRDFARDRGDLARDRVDLARDRDFARDRERGRDFGFDRERERDYPWGRERERDYHWQRERERDYALDPRVRERGMEPLDRDRTYMQYRQEYERMDDRGLFAERRYLESQMLERFRLDDPYMERRRLDDVTARREYLDKMHRERIAREEENDPDKLRLKRFNLRQAASAQYASATDSPKVEDASYRPSMEELLARRKQNREIADRLQERPRVEETLLSTSQSGAGSGSNSQSKEESLAKRVMATKSVQEEVAKNPQVNVSDLLTKLSSSMIASEDEAAMALQISSALTQALLSYRLQSGSIELSSLMESTTPAAEKPRESAIPGLGSGPVSSSAATSVPSFLKTPEAGPQYAYPSQTETQSYYQQAYQAPAGQVVDQSYMQQTGLQTSYQAPASPYDSQAYYVPSSQTGVQYQYASPYEQTASSVPSSNEQNGSQLSYASPATQTGPQVSYQDPYQQTGTLTSSQPAASSAVESAMANASVTTLAADTDQPQKHILESIRKQTELLKKKIQMATSANTKPSGGSAAQSMRSPAWPGSSPSVDPSLPMASPRSRGMASATSAAPPPLGLYSNPARPSQYAPQPVPPPQPRPVPPPPHHR